MLLHELHHLVAHVGAVLDRCHAAEHRALHAFLAVRVRGDAIAVVLRGVDDRLHFLDGELRRIAGLRVRQHAARRSDLDDVAAFLVALAHGTARVVDGVDDAFGRTRRADQVRERVVVAVGGIGVAAGGRDRLAGRPDARAGHRALVDRVAQVRADFAAEVAHAGEAGHQRLLRVVDRAEGVIDIVEAEAFGIALRARLAAQVHVQVGPAGHAGVAAQVHARGAGDVGARATDHLLDLAVAHQQRLRPGEFAGSGVEDLAALERLRGVLRGRSGLGFCVDWNAGDGGKQGKAERLEHVRLPVWFRSPGTVD